MNHLKRLSNEGNLYARRQFAWLANRERLLQKVNNVPMDIVEPFKPVPVDTKKRNWGKIFKDFIGMLLM